MIFTWKALSTSMIAAAGAVPVALALSATANAEPVAPAPAIPGAPNLPIVNQLANVPAAAPQLLQGVSSALTGAPAAAPAPAPSATASVTLPQAPTAVTPAAANAPLGSLVPGRSSGSGGSRGRGPRNEQPGCRSAGSAADRRPALIPELV
ncbi:hypothetical protein [Mycolicibacterium neworleansense]|uniref:Uncharacterized protein n=1 Tax=Mycolicibacterium neworleansense TaxID=146018 RepID=A0A0H5RWC2_9MYCO|nr:hypothetical protein BN2156_05129 [Mycolicibacterium neworleansense]